MIKRQINVDERVSIAIIACMINGNYLEAAIVSAIMVLGALIEEAVSDSARNAIEQLKKMTPETATIERGGKKLEIKVCHIIRGDVLRVKAGEIVPVDGTVIDGETLVDESSITGESIPIHKESGCEVFAGTPWPMPLSRKQRR